MPVLPTRGTITCSRLGLEALPKWSVVRLMIEERGGSLSVSIVVTARNLHLLEM